MITAISLIVSFVLLALVWVAVLAVYNMFLEPFDFGPLSTFAAKSVALVMIVALFVTFVPLGGLASLLVWWIGLMLIFKKDFWECKILVILIWGVSFLLSLGIGLVLSSMARSPVATV